MNETGLHTFSHPSHEKALALFETGCERGAVISLFGRCRVEYDGRAASTLAAGNRLVVCKPDGAILVHTDEGQKPVNWLPPGCTHHAHVESDELRIESQRSTPDEELLIYFERVDHAVAYDATSASELSMTGTEADLRERILDDPSVIEPGFEPRATERETAAGAVDIYGVDADENAVVLELKRRRVGPDAVSQLNRYVAVLDRELHTGTQVRGILVAPSVTYRAQNLLEKRGLEFVSLSPRFES